VTPPIPAPAPGVYRDVPAAEYHAWDAASNSRLSTLLRSPAHMYHEVTHPHDPTDAQVLGDATHLYVLQPEVAPTRYVVAGQCEAFSKAGAPCANAGKHLRAGRWFCGVKGHDPEGGALGEHTLTVLTLDQDAVCGGMAAAVRAHPAARQLLDALTETELSVVWDDAAGVRCKLRTDGLAGGLGVVVDLKTTTDASPDGFTKSIFAYGYHRQAAFYLRGLAAAGVAPTPDIFTFIAVEKLAPFAVAVYQVRPDAIEAGTRQIERLLETYRRCDESGTWPGYGDEPMQISLPAWAWNQIDGEG
jgi:hypothetical protein